MTDPKRKTYLGDGAYVQHGSWPGEIVLTTENGIGVQNTIALDLALLMAWWEARRGVCPECHKEHPFHSVMGCAGRHEAV